MPDRFGGIAIDSIPDQATRNAFRRTLGALGNMFLEGNAADRPSSARVGAFWVNLDANNEVYWYAGPTIGWLQIHSDSSGGVPTVLHESLSDLQGGAANDHKHLTAAEVANLLTAAQKLALVDNMAVQGAGYGFGPTRVLFAAADGSITTDEGMTYNAATDALTLAEGLGIGGAPGSFMFEVTKDAGLATAAFSAYSATAGHYPYNVFLRGRGTRASPTAVSSGDDIGWFYWQAWYDATHSRNVVGIRAVTSEAHDSTHGGTYLSFRAVTNAATALTEIMRLANAQTLHNAGTAAAPAIANITRPDDGVYFISDGAIGVALNGALALTVGVSGGHCLLTLA